MTAGRRVALVAAVLCLFLLLFGGSEIDQVNITWDEALGDLFFGERYFAYFTTFDSRFLDFESDPWGPERQPDLGISPFRGRPWEYPPVAATLGAATREVLSRRLGWFDTFDGFHAVNLLLTLVFVPVWLGLLQRRVGLVAAVASVGLLFASPRIVAHWLANLKDFPSMTLFSLTALVGLTAVESGRTRRVLAVGLLWGLALGTKFNALFLPAIPALALLGWGIPAAWSGRVRQLLVALAGAGAVGTATLVAVWPWLWSDPAGRLVQHVSYLAGRRAYTSDASLAPVFEAILTTTPPVFLGLILVGVVPLVQRLRRRDPLGWWITAWIVVVLGRYLPPQAVNFDGVRHFLELFPALAIVGGLGLSWVFEILAARLPVRRGRLAVLLVGLAVAPGASAVLASHPFELAYWNVFMGGPAGAWSSGKPQAGDYWGTSYRTGLRWIEENAEEGSFLAVPVIEHAVRLVASERLRKDVQLLPITTPFSPRIAPERQVALDRLATTDTVYVMFVPRRDWMNELMLDCLQRLPPEAVWELDGVPVLLIYRYRPAALPPTAIGPRSSAVSGGAAGGSETQEPRSKRTTPAP